MFMHIVSLLTKLYVLTYFVGKLFKGLIDSVTWIHHYHHSLPFNFELIQIRVILQWLIFIRFSDNQVLKKNDTKQTFEKHV